MARASRQQKSSEDRKFIDTVLQPGAGSCGRPRVKSASKPRSAIRGAESNGFGHGLSRPHAGKPQVTDSAALLSQPFDAAAANNSVNKTGTTMRTFLHFLALLAVIILTG